MLAVLFYAVIGLVTGLIAKRIMSGSDRGSALTLAVVGLIGALVSGLGTNALLSYGRQTAFHYGPDHATGTYGTGLPAYWMSYLMAIVGAIFVLAIYKLIKAKRPRA